MANQGLNTDETVRELFFALEQLNQLDYQAEHIYYNSSGNHGTQSLNGFFIRDLSSNSMGSSINYKWNNSNPNLVRDVSSLHGDAMGNTSSSSVSGEMSKDQVTYLMVGLILVDKLLPTGVTYTENGISKHFAFDSQITDIKVEARIIANRIFHWVANNNTTPIKHWHIENPVRGVHVDDGFDFTTLSYPLDELYLEFFPGSSSLFSNSAAKAGASTINFAAKNTLVAAANSGEVDMQLTLATISNGWGSSTKSVLENNCFGTLPNNATFDYLALLYAIVNNETLSNNYETYFRTLLSTAPINGPYNYNDAAGMYPHFEWSTSRRYTRPYNRGKNDQSRPGDYNGLDYMIIHNLYCLYYNKSNVLGYNKISLRTDMIKNPFDYFGHYYYNVANQMPEIYNHSYTEHCEMSGSLFINRYMPSEANYYSATSMPVNNSTFTLNLEAPLYDITTKPSMIKSVNNGLIQLGEVAGQKHLNGVINIKDGASLVIANGSTLKMYENSEINVEDGGQLIFENGSDVKLYANTKINVYSGGHLSIGQTATIYLENTQNIIRYFSGAKMCNLYPQVSSIIPIHPSSVNNAGYGSIILDNCATVRCSEDLLSIVGNVTWDNESHYFNGTYNIGPNAQLTISNSLIEFGPEGKLVVQPGGRLIIDNSSLTGDPNCNTYWKGIEVWGNEQLTQIPTSNQGYLLVKNNSTISDADMGVRAMKLNPNGNYDWNSGGGIIKLENSNFTNNNNSVWIGSYHSPVHSFNMSNISNCEFELNNNMYSGHDGYAFVNLYDVDRVGIYGNTFKNLKTGMSIEDRARGIIAYEAALNVFAICNDANQTVPPTPCNNLDKNFFEGLYYGIYAANSSAFNSSIVNIDQADFVNVYHGVHLIGTKNAVIDRCNFQIAESQVGGDVTISYGVFLNGCDGYKVEENSFTKFSNGMDIRGVLVDNSGDNNNEIYKNTFTDIQVSIQAQRDNRGDKSGLKLFCNDMNSQYLDIYVRDEGIGEYQKISTLSGSPTYLPAGDKFTPCTQNSNGSNESNIKNRGDNIKYVYKPNDKPNCVTYNPNDHSHDVVLIQGGYGSAMECPTKISTGDDDIIALQSELSTAKIALNSSKVLLAIWKDGGNANLDEQVETTQPWDVYVEFNNLIAKSPYLSEDVIMATIENPAFTSLMIKLVMIANPHAKRNAEIMDAIYNRIPTMPQSYIDAINADDSNVSQLEILSANVSADKHLVSTISNNIKRVYRMDYDNPNAINSLISFVISENTLESQYELASLYLETAQFDSMNTVLNNIDVNYSLDDQQTIDLANWQIYYGIAQSVKESDTQYGVLSESQKTSLETIKNLNRPLISSAAIALLLSNDNEYSYHEVVLPITEGNARMSQAHHAHTTDIEVDNSLKLYPNPSHDYLTLEYKTSSKYSKLWFEISDARGSIVMKQDLKVGSNEELVNISNLQANIYTLILYADGERIAVEKITVIK